jgi:hypothetical protein
MEKVMTSAGGPFAHSRMKKIEKAISLGLRATESSIEKSRNRQKECPRNRRLVQALFH